MKIAAAIIVKNEEDVIGRMIDSLATGHLIQQLVIVDTGSTDGTPASIQSAKERNDPCSRVVRTFQSKIFDADTKPEDFHFGDARNEALEYIDDDVDWIISIDADEVAHFDADGLHAFLEERGPNGPDWYNVRLDMFFGDHKSPSVDKYSFRRGSLFRNRPDIRWKRRVHEELTTTSHPDPFVHLLPEELLRMEHHKPLDRPNSNDRNLPMLEKQAREDNRVTRTWLQIGQIHFERLNFVTALGFIHAYIEGDGDEWTSVTQAYTLRGYCYYHIGLTDLAIKDGREVISLHPHCRHGYILTATAYMKGGNFTMARFYLQQSLKLPETDPLFLSKGRTSDTLEINEKLAECERMLAPTPQIPEPELVEA